MKSERKWEVLVSKTYVSCACLISHPLERQNIITLITLPIESFATDEILRWNDGAIDIRYLNDQLNNELV